LFSLGTVLYAMCTGHPPFRASGTHAVLKRVIDASPRPIRAINNEIPDWLCAIIEKLHAKKPEDRFPTAKEVGELLGQRLADLQAGRAIPSEPSRVSDRVEAPEADAAGRPHGQHGSPRRWRWLRWVAAAVFVCVGGFLLTELDGLSRVFYAPSYRVALSSDDPETCVRIWSMAQDEPPMNLEGDLKILGTPAYLLENLSTAELDLPVGNYLVVADLNGREGDRQFIKVWHNYFSTAHHLPNADWRAGSFIGTGLGDRINGGGHRSVTITAAANLLKLKQQKLQATAVPDEPGWVQLFNGKDFTGWITEPRPGIAEWGAADWHIDKAVGGLWAVGKGPQRTFLFTERDDFGDFHLRAEVAVGDNTESGIFFRCGDNLPHGMFPAGYQAYIGSQPLALYHTGTLLRTTAGDDRSAILFKVSKPTVPAGTFFRMEVISRGTHIAVKVNDKTVADYIDPDSAFNKKGRIALQVRGRDSVIFKKIEIKENAAE
jgi:hypothetical protein